MLGFLDTFDAVTFTSAIFGVCFFFVEKNARFIVAFLKKTPSYPCPRDDDDVALHEDPVRKVVVDACAAENMVVVVDDDDDDEMM